MRSFPRRQSGIALLLLLFLTSGVAATLLLSTWNGGRLQREQELRTQLALQQARAALIAYATSVYPAGSRRPGDLPCPDLDDDGVKETACGSANGSTGQDKRLGRLPWKSLGLPDLRDATGERLWYAVSSNFKENTRYLPLNSDTTGTIQVTDASGTTTSNVIAVVIAPGAPLIRFGDTSMQDRSPGGENSPANYLDRTSGEDNANFIDSSSNGFIAGPIRDAAGNMLVNDQLLVITYADLMPLIEKQVANTVFNCLNNYAAYNDGTSNNLGRYPWPASVATSADGNYDDTANTLFGRIPNLMLNTSTSAPSMQSSWGGIPECTITDDWFAKNWREQVFYAIADAYKPDLGAPACGVCLTVGTTNNVRLTVFISRRALALQDRSVNSLAASYLEGENATPHDGLFVNGALSASFNDLLVFK